MNLLLPGSERMRITKPGTTVNFEIIHKRRGYQANDIKLGRYEDPTSALRSSSMLSSLFCGLSLVSNVVPRLETVTYIPEGYEAINCTICLEILECMESVIKLPCKHLFHENCLKEWLSNSKTCPVCRSKVAT